MSMPFSQTTRALAADRFGRSALMLALAVFLLAAWGSWLLQGRVAILVVSETARLEVAAHVVEAPVAGRLGELAALRAGAFVEAGDDLGAIVPPGALRAVAYLPAADALGRVLPGQAARLRLDGFEWTRYGSVAATVERVASEPQDGLVRVELRVEPASAPHIPLQHGLPGKLEIEIGWATPAALVLRHAARRLPS